MSEAFRQKLLNWFCSMLVLLLSCSIFAILNWHSILTTTSLIGEFQQVENYVPLLGEGLAGYLMFFPFFLFWHGFDFVEKDAQPPASRSMIGRYSFFLIIKIIVIASLIAAVVMDQNGWNQCHSPQYFYAAAAAQIPDVYYDHCPIDYNASVVFLIGGPLMFVACLGKALVSIRSNFVAD